MDTTEKVKGYRCIKCNEEYGIDEIRYVCKKCGGNLQVAYNYQRIRKFMEKSELERNTDFSIWRYVNLLPINDLSHIPKVQIGWTPLYRADVLGGNLGLHNLYIKDDGRNPSASSKDRASGIVMVKALEAGESVITGASTGNAASSLSCLAAPTRLKTVLFVPTTAPRAKIAQLLVFGSSVIAVQGTYDEAYDLCIKATDEYGWYNRNTGFNPFTREGKKTVSFEICEQMGWECPDKVFVPVGDGNMISGVWKGFVDLREIGFIDQMPQLIACQAQNSDAVKRAFESDGILRPVSGETVADSISVGFPRDGDAALKAIHESGGFALAVSDDAIISAIPEMARSAGIFAEPAGVTAYAALKKAVNDQMVNPEERIVILVTGNGLKDIDAAMRSAGKPLAIRPDLEELKSVLREVSL
jgi:threonine synthase